MLVESMLRKKLNSCYTISGDARFSHKNSQSERDRKTKSYASLDNPEWFTKAIKVGQWIQSKQILKRV